MSSYDNAGEMYYFISWGGGGGKVVFHPPPPQKKKKKKKKKTCQNFCEFLRYGSKCFFGGTKVILLVQKKKDFDGKPKMTKISRFENFQIAKMG